MPAVSGNVRTWGFQPFPTDESLIVRFVPSSAGFASGTLLPLREESVEPAADGSFTVNLAQTTAVLNDVWFTIRFEWFARYGLDGSWVAAGWSELPGKLRVNATGGLITDLLEAATIAPVSIVHGYGPPPSGLDGVLYIDRSGEFPVLYAPEGALI